MASLTLILLAFWFFVVLRKFDETQLDLFVFMPHKECYGQQFR